MYKLLLCQLMYLIKEIQFIRLRAVCPAVISFTPQRGGFPGSLISPTVWSSFSYDVDGQ